MALSGTELLIAKVIKLLGIDPQIILEHVAQMRKSVENGAGDIAILRRDQLRIMQHLGIEHDGNEQQAIGSGHRLNG